MAEQVKIGMRFKADIADGRPLWEVIESVGKGVWKARCLGPDWEGHVQPFDAAVILGSRERDRNLINYINDRNAWEQSLPVGTIIHYCDGFGKFVRYEVVEGEPVETLTKKVLPRQKCLKPLALVGNYGGYELPRWAPDGTVHYDYHAEKIVSGKLQTFPNVIYEYMLLTGEADRYEDPRNMPAVSLEIEPMTEEQAHLAENYRLAREVSKILEQYPVTDAVVKQAWGVIQKAVANMPLGEG